MPKQAILIIDPMKSTPTSRLGKFLREYLAHNEVRSERQLIAKDVIHHHQGRAFKLTHDLHHHIVKEDGVSYSKYEIKNNQLHDKGMQGSVGAYLGTLVPLMNGLLYLPRDRMFKQIDIDGYKSVDILECENEVDDEILYANHGKKLSAKRLFTIKTRDANAGIYFSMNRAKGVKLSDWIDIETKSKKKRADYERLMRLSLALIQALYLQVTRFQIIHRDIKPDNIFIEENIKSGEFFVTILDYGFATKDTVNEIPCRGTKAYQAPEYRVRGRRVKYDLKCDVYSLARVLAQVWGDGHPCWSSSEASSQSDQEPVDHLLGKLFDAYQDDKNKESNSHREVIEEKIRQALADGHAQTSENRSELIKFYYDFMNIIPVDFYQQGFQCRNELISENHDEAAFLEKLQQAISHCDSPASIQHFVSGLGWDCLKRRVHGVHSVSTGDDLLHEIKAILNSKKSALARLAAEALQIEAQISICERYIANLPNVRLYHDLKKSFQAIHGKVLRRKNKIEALSFDLDEIDKKTNKLLAQPINMNELAGLIYENPKKDDGGSWTFPRDLVRYRVKAAAAFVNKAQEWISHSSFSPHKKQILTQLAINESIDFSKKRRRIVNALAGNKYQKQFVSLCLAEAESGSYFKFEDYIKLIEILNAFARNEDQENNIFSLIKNTISEYLQETATDQNIFLYKHAASPHRLTDIKAILNKLHHLVEFNGDKQNKFVEDLIGVMGQMHVSRFGHSLLKKKIESAIHMFNMRRKPEMAKTAKQKQGIVLVDVTNEKSLKALTSSQRRDISAWLRSRTIVSSDVNKRILGHQTHSLWGQFKAWFRSHILVPKNTFMPQVEKDEVYEIKGQTYKFSHSMFLSSKPDSLQGAPLQPVFCVVDSSQSGLLFKSESKGHIVRGVHGVLEVMHTDGLNFYPQKNNHLIHYWSELGEGNNALMVDKIEEHKALEPTSRTASHVTYEVKEKSLFSNKTYHPVNFVYVQNQPYDDFNEDHKFSNGDREALMLPLPQPASFQNLADIRERCTHLMNQACLVKSEAAKKNMPAAWRDLFDFHAQLFSLGDQLMVDSGTHNYFEAKLRKISESLQASTKGVRKISFKEFMHSPDNLIAKQLRSYLEKQAELGKTSFEKNEVFLDKDGYSYCLPFAITTRSSSDDRSLRYDITDKPNIANNKDKRLRHQLANILYTLQPSHKGGLHCKVGKNRRISKKPGQLKPMTNELSKPLVLSQEASLLEVTRVGHSSEAEKPAKAGLSQSDGVLRRNTGEHNASPVRSLRSDPSAIISHGEFDRLKKVGGFKPKRNQDGSITMLRKPGEPFGDFIAQPKKRDKWKLSLSLVQSLYQQVHAHQEVHGDIKPDNLLVDELFNQDQHNQICHYNCYWVDFEKGTWNDYGRHPEAQHLRHTPSYRDDLFGVGVMLAQLWGEIPLEKIQFPQSNNLCVIDFLTQYVAKNENIPEELKKIIFNLLLQQPNFPYQMADDLLKELCEIYSKIGNDKLTQHSKAYLSGVNLRNQLLNLSSGSEFIKHIRDTDVNLSDADSVDAFCRGLGFRVLLRRPIQNKDELLAHIEAYFYHDRAKEFTMLNHVKSIWNAELQKLNDVITATEADPKFKDRYFSDASIEEVKWAIASADKKLNKIDRNYANLMDLDLFAEGCERLKSSSLSHFINKHKTAFALAEKFAPRIAAINLKKSYEEGQLPQSRLRQGIAKVLNDYESKYLKGFNLQNERGAASKRRRQDVAELVRQVKSIHDDQRLMRAVSDYVMDTMKGHGIFSCWTGNRGALSKGLMSVINQERKISGRQA